jgi:hypothetical protein
MLEPFPLPASYQFNALAVSHFTSNELGGHHLARTVLVCLRIKQDSALTDIERIVLLDFIHRLVSQE